MDKTLVSDKRFLYAYCILDGALDDMSEEKRTVMIFSITKIKEEMLKDYQPSISPEKTLKKYQNNEVCQNKGKVSK